MTATDPDSYPDRHDLPLGGIRVIDWVDGPLQGVGRILADLGAQVIRVEPPSGSPARRAGVRFEGSGLTFAIRNANKLGITADVGTPTGRARLRSLLSTADILLTDQSARHWDLLDLPPRALRGLNPTLVTMNLSDFGRTGPRSDWTGTADVHFALSSVLSRSGLPEITEPLLPPPFLAYEAATAQAAWAVMLAYLQRLSTGLGDHVDFAVLDGLIQVLDPPLGIGGSARAGAAFADLPRGRPDARHLYPIFAARDGWVRICVLSPRQWQGMLDWLDRPVEFADPRFNNINERFAAAPRLYPLIAAMFAGLTKDQATEQGQGHGVPTAALLSTDEVLATDAYREGGHFAAVSLGAGHTATIPTGLFEIDDVRTGYRSPAPAVGEHDDHVTVDRRAPDFPQWRASNGNGSRPFEGLRVLDLGVIVVGAELGRLLGDYGADVIKVESREFPDGSRQSYDGSEITPGFAWGHRNKRSIGLNLRTPHGKRLFADLVAASDVVLTNFKPGTLESLGFGYRELTAINPRIVLSESSAFGNHGPWSRRMGYGPLVRASAGMSLQWCYPQVPGSFADAITIFPDHVVARLNAIAVGALLLRRARTGRGGRVSTAQVDAIFSGMADQLALESLAPDARTQDLGRGGDAPRGVFPAAGDDNWLVVDVTSDGQFAALAKVLNRPEWVKRFETAAQRLAHRRELVDAVASWTVGRDAAAAATELQSAGVPAGPMLRPAELADDEHLRLRGVFGPMLHPMLGDELLTNLAEARFGNVPPPLLEPAPRQAQHTRNVIRDVLMLPDELIDRLIDDGALQVHPGSLQKV